MLKFASFMVDSYTAFEQLKTMKRKLKYLRCPAYRFTLFDIMQRRLIYHIQIKDEMDLLDKVFRHKRPRGRSLYKLLSFLDLYF